MGARDWLFFPFFLLSLFILARHRERQRGTQ
jgi:hypothetical protein